jgi:sRNA-binding protein
MRHRAQPLATEPLGFYVVSLRSVRAGMKSPHQIERQRGIKEAGQQLGALRERWPLAFPVQHQDIRPLALGVAHQVAAGMGWSLPYTLSVLRRWKMAAVYCQAVLSHDQRIALDGTPAETVDAGAKDLAAKRLARFAARNAAKKAAAPFMAKPPTDRVHATPLRRRT